VAPPFTEPICAPPVINSSTVFCLGTTQEASEGEDEFRLLMSCRLDMIAPSSRWGGPSSSATCQLIPADSVQAEKNIWLPKIAS
jgi:hypothetical protein